LQGRGVVIYAEDRPKADPVGIKRRMEKRMEMMNENITRENDGTSLRDKSGKIVEWLREKQAEDVLSLDVRDISSYTEAMVIVSAQNIRHAQALADWILAKFAETGMEVLGIEGYHPGYWILLDGNDVVLHIFQSEYRTFYNLDGLWREAPRMVDDSASVSEARSS